MADVTDAEVEVLAAEEMKLLAPPPVREPSPRETLAFCWPDGKRLMVAIAEVLPNGETRLKGRWQPATQADIDMVKNEQRSLRFARGGPSTVGEAVAVDPEKEKSKLPLILGAVGVAGAIGGLVWAFWPFGDAPDEEYDD